MRSRLRRVVPVLIVLALLAGGYWWWQGRAETVNGGDVVSGTIEATEVTVAAEVSGRVAAVNAAEGDIVRAGQELVVFDTALLQAQRQQAEANLAAVQGTQAAAEANVTAAQAKLDQVKAGARPQEIAAEEQAVAAAQGRVDTAQAQLAQSPRRAPGGVGASATRPSARFAQVKEGARAEGRSGARQVPAGRGGRPSGAGRLRQDRLRGTTRARCRNRWRWSRPR